MDERALGDALPRRGNAVTEALSRAILRLFGWRIDYENLPNVPKMVLVGAPHTSNLDFVLTLLTIFALSVDVHWMAKHSVFRCPVGGIMRWLGGIPIDRRDRHNVVEQTVAQFAAHDAFILAITPEGTRKKVRIWKTGFYHIARTADVPIVPVVFDFGNKVLRIGPAFALSGDETADLATIRTFYAGVRGRHPSRM